MTRIRRSFTEGFKREALRLYMLLGAPFDVHCTVPGYPEKLAQTLDHPGAWQGVEP